MSAPWWALLAFWAGTPEEVQTLRVEPRDVVGFFQTSPSRSLGVTNPGRISEVMQAVLESATRGDLVELDEGTVDACQANVACVCDAYGVEARSLGRSMPTYVLQLSRIPLGEADRMQLRVISTSSVARLRAEAGSSDREVLEGVLSAAVVYQTDWVEVRDPRDFRAQAEVWLQGMVALWRREGLLWPWSSVDVFGLVPGATIRVGTRILGTSAGDRIVLEDVPEGQLELTVDHPEYETERVSVWVDGGKRARAELRLRERSLPTAELSGLATYGGLGAAAGGVALLVAGAAGGAGSSSEGCWALVGSESPCSGWYSAGGLGMLPAGMGLTLWGASWLVGGLALGADWELAVTMAGGVLAGLVTYAAVSAAGPR